MQDAAVHQAQPPEKKIHVRKGRQPHAHQPGQRRDAVELPRREAQYPGKRPARNALHKGRRPKQPDCVLWRIAHQRVPGICMWKSFYAPRASRYRPVPMHISAMSLLRRSVFSRLAMRMPAAMPMIWVTVAARARP